MMLLLGAIGAICLNCLDDDALRPRWRQVDVQVEQAIPDGCARFQIHANPGQSATVDTIYGTQYCQTNELKLIQDSAAVFDAATGKLRVPIVVKNVGTKAVRGLLKIRYDADSVQMFDANGNPVPGPTTIVGLGDSTLNNGRAAYWGYNQLLAPAGELQVLFAGQTSGRRWLELQGTDWDKMVKIKLFTTAKYDTVPASVPTGMPAYVTKPSWQVASPIGGGFPYIRDHVMVRFWPSASTASRQAAIDLVGGVVVGGTGDAQGVDGYYYVRIPSDTTEQRIKQAIRVLKAHPAVMVAIQDYFVKLGTTHRRPADGPQWTTLDWRVDSVNTSHGQWGLEYLRVPLAWGCETGDSALRVGVLDEYFSINATYLSDLRANVVDTSKASLVSTVRPPHGAWVASTLGARGNNSQGIAGGVWRAGLDLRHPVVLDSAYVPVPDTGWGGYRALEAELRHMAAAGDRVVNISLGADSTRVFSVADSVQLRQASEVAGGLAWAVRTPSANNQPSDVVVVVSAGNVENGDPRESLFPLLRDSLRNRVIVVRAMSKSAQLLNAVSAGNSYIDFAAPGEEIGTLDLNGGTTTFSGSSAATPLVSAVVTLMRSFAPSLPGDSVPHYLRMGALNGGRTAGGFPVPDAYETLKLLALRPGAPICGNMVLQNTTYHDGAGTFTIDVLVKRTAGNGGFESIYSKTMPVDTGFGEIAITHGGKDLLRLPDFTPPYVRIAKHSGTSWQVLPAPYATVPSPDLTGSTNSRRAISHDGDSTFYTSGVDDAPFYQSTSYSFGVQIAGTARPPIVQYASIPDRWSNPLSGICCYGGGSSAGATISPNGKFAVVVTRSGSNLATFQFDRISLPSGAKTPLFSDASYTLPLEPPRPFTFAKTLQGLSISEDGNELSYYTHTDWDVPRSCIAKRYSLKSMTLLSADAVSSDFCSVWTGGAARARTPVIGSR